MRMRPAAPVRRPASCHLVLLALAVAGVASCTSGAARQGATPVPAKDSLPPAPTSAAELVARMRDRYVGKWYTTLTFLQHNTLYRSGGGEDRSDWREFMSVPGRLRIEYLPGGKSGVIFENGRVHAFDSGKRVQTQTRIHPLLLVGADVYAIPPEVTLRRLDSLGVNLAAFRADTFAGARVYVVGGARGDSISPQVWIDADRLVALRVVERETRGTRTIVTDSRFTKYVDMGGVPVATEMLFLREGRPIFKEEYADVQINVPLSDALFDPARWNDARR